MNQRRLDQIRKGLNELPKVRIKKEKLKNGERIDSDEAEVWKRVLQYRISKFVNPKFILETHPGKNVGTRFFLKGSPQTKFMTVENLIATKKGIRGKHIIDIDPFGQPWDHLELITPFHYCPTKIAHKK